MKVIYSCCILHVEIKVSECLKHVLYHHIMTGTLQISKSSSAPVLTEDFQFLLPYTCRKFRVASMTGGECVEKCMSLTHPSLHPRTAPSHSPAMCCGAAHLWTLLNGALVWPDSSPLLHFPSNLPAQPSDCHRKAVNALHSFCIAALFPQPCLTIVIFYLTACFVYLLYRRRCLLLFFFLFSAVCSLTGYFHPNAACQSTVSSALSIICLVFVSICRTTA